MSTVAQLTSAASIANVFDEASPYAMSTSAVARQYRARQLRATLPVREFRSRMERSVSRVHAGVVCSCCGLCLESIFATLGVC